MFIFGFIMYYCLTRIRWSFDNTIFPQIKENEIEVNFCKENLGKLCLIGKPDLGIKTSILYKKKHPGL